MACGDAMAFISFNSSVMTYEELTRKSHELQKLSFGMISTKMLTIVWNVDLLNTRYLKM